MRAQALLPALFAVMLAGCVSNRMDDDGTIQTTSEANRSGIGGALAAPLRDVNLLRTKIPAILLKAHAEAYARPEPTGCKKLIAEVRELDTVLGPDLDKFTEDENGGLITRDRAENTALGFVADTAQDVIPLRGWVRKLTGAERHDRLVAESITAGRVRRAYLKGLGESRGCNPPGTPQHMAETPPPETQHPEPHYPIE